MQAMVFRGRCDDALHLGLFHRLAPAFLRMVRVEWYVGASTAQHAQYSRIGDRIPDTQDGHTATGGQRVGTPLGHGIRFPVQLRVGQGTTSHAQGLTPAVGGHGAVEDRDGIVPGGIVHVQKRGSMPSLQSNASARYFCAQLG